MHVCPRGPMDKASAYEAGDCGFESRRRLSFLPLTFANYMHHFSDLTRMSTSSGTQHIFHSIIASNAELQKTAIQTHLRSLLWLLYLLAELHCTYLLAYLLSSPLPNIWSSLYCSTISSFTYTLHCSSRYLPST